MTRAVLDRVGEWVTAHREQAIGEWADWIRQPSVSSDGTGFPAATEYGADLFRRCGLTPDTVETAGGRSILGTSPDGPAGTPHVLIYGHLRRAAAWSADRVAVSPVRARHQERTDVRPRYRRQQGPAPRPAARAAGPAGGGRLAALPGDRVLDGEEEIGSPNLAAAVRRRFPAGSEPDLAVWSDGPVHESGRATVVLGVRGIVMFQVRLTGAVAPLHSGNWGGVAPNPAWRLVHLLASMRSPTAPCSSTAPANGVEPLSPARQAAYEALPPMPAVLGQPASRRMELLARGRTSTSALSRPTFTINSLDLQDAGEHRTIIPNVAVAKCDMRLVAGQRAANVISGDPPARRQSEPAAEVTFGASMEPHRTLPETRYTEAVIQGTRAGLGEEPLLLPALGGSLPIAEFGDALGIPCYGIPFANADERNHAPNENMEVGRFLRGISGAAGVLLALGGAL